LSAHLKIALVLAGGVLLAGCWQSKVDFYESDTPLTPFKPGQVTTTDSDGKVTHSTLSLDDGVYVLGRGTAGFRLRFFPLAGAPKDYLLIEAEIVHDCKGNICAPLPANPLHFFAVAHLDQAGGAEELAANCDGDTAKALGATQLGPVCDFSDRATPEKALRTLIDSTPVSTVNPE
jgi:hypothetical protein